MIDELALTLNAQFYKTSPQATDADFLAVLDAACDARVPELPYLANEIRREAVVPGCDFRYSLRIFRSTRPVYFLANDDISDLIYSFILILEIGDHFAILKKSCSSLTNVIDRIGHQVGSSDLTSTFDDNQVAFQKLSVRNMTISDKAMRARSYEAASLQGLISTHSAGRSIPYFVRVRRGSQLTSLSLTTSRVFDSSERKGIETVAKWAQEKIRKISEPARSNKEFLSSFAKAIDLERVLAVASPLAVLIESGALKELLEEESAVPFRIKDGSRKELSDRLLGWLFLQLERVFEVDADWNLLGAKGKVRRNKKSLSVWFDLLRKIHIDIGGKEVTLQSAILKNGFFSVCFSDPRYMYFLGQCFEDSSGKAQTDDLLKILIPQPLLEGAVSEKGEPIPASNTRFDVTSVFAKVEQIFASDDFIFCDDLNDEWADHICLNLAESRISFVHSKQGDKSTSASNLHVIVGQGIKNLGNMFFDLDAIKNKNSSKWVNLYPGTRIRRKRRGVGSHLERVVRRLLADYRLERQCILACDFLSKSAVEREFDKIKRGQPVRGHVIQLFWIISSFAHAAKEMSVVPKIYCVP